MKTNESTQPRAGIFYYGTSMLDSAPIVGIALYPAGSATNRKTGRMVQTFILRADIDPVSAIYSGDDASICGDCKHRGRNGALESVGFVGDIFKHRSCYVNVGQSVQSVYRAFKRGAYPHLTRAQTRALGRGRMVRIGAYGDPAAIPPEYWRALLADSSGHTGYTHQWHRPRFGALSAFCMASVDSRDEHERARADGWRTFRTMRPDESLAPLEVSCPASAEAGARIQCNECRACAGTNGRKGTIAIVAHGSFARSFAANQSASASPRGAGIARGVIAIDPDATALRAMYR